MPPAVTAQQQLPSSPERRRPFVYVSDLPPMYNAQLLQYKLKPSACSWRLFHGPENFPYFNDGTYAIETYLHEAMLASPHRSGSVGWYERGYR